MRDIFNVSLIVRDSHKTVSTDHNFRRERRAEADSKRGPSAYRYLLQQQKTQVFRTQSPCESLGDHPGLPVPETP